MLLVPCVWPVPPQPLVPHEDISQWPLEEEQQEGFSLELRIPIQALYETHLEIVLNPDSWDLVLRPPGGPFPE